MKLYRADAIVLRTRDYGEADKLLTLYARSQGKVQAIVKGVRKPKSRMRGGVQPLCYSDFQLYEGRSLDTVTQCELQEPFAQIKRDLKKLAYAIYLAELLEGMVPERDGNERVFLLLLSVLQLLEHGEQEDLATRLFEVRLMGMLGFQPSTSTCVQCGSPVQGAGVRFSSGLGGVLCPRCQGADPGAMPVTGDVLAVMEQLARMDLKMLDRLRVTPGQAERLGELMKDFIRCHTEKRLRSLDFIEEIRHE